MDSQIIFSSADNSIDLVGAVIFTTAFVHSCRYLWLNHLNEQGRIIYLFIMTVSALHVVQVLFQLVIGHSTPFSIRLWDIINYLTAVLLLMAVHRIYKKETK